MEMIHERLASARSQAGMSLRELSDKSGVSFTYLHELEKGLKNPSVKVVQKIAASLGVAPAWLVNADWDKAVKPGEIPKEIIPASCLMRLPASWVADIINEAIRAGLVKRCDQ